jgi:hypothetical protein
MDEPLLVTRILIFVLINQLLTEHFTDGDIIATVQNEEEDKMLVIRNMNQGDNFTKRSFKQYNAIFLEKDIISSALLKSESSRYQTDRLS